MQYMGLNEIREKFLSFFETKRHLRVKSSSLVPQNDSSLLLVNSGMAPMKPYFTGQVAAPSARITTCQKCIRTPDIERVGKTSRHGTFFEMLGNFSFGDYFKTEATAWAWEFVTDVMKIPVDRLWVSVYLDDDEAFDMWTQEVGVPKERMVRLGKADNFWEIGAGPCGPCSEIYFDRGERYACSSPDCAVGCDCDRYVEFWNLVFSQFNNDGNGSYTELSQKNIDTGMGLERLACILQGVDSIFDVDTIKNITKRVCEIAHVQYGDSDKTDVSLRVITDHIRSTVMMVCDGIIPSNEGRGYVLRRLLRRAARHGKLLGIQTPFLYQVCDTVIDESKQAYPELSERRDYIKKIIKIEEERFSVTIDSGLKILRDLIDCAISNSVGSLDAYDVFKLYDTFGFPVDLTLEILEERSLTTDIDLFNSLMKQQKDTARKASDKSCSTSWNAEELGLDRSIKTEFLGYESLENDAQILALICDGELVESAREGQDVSVILDRTSFYAQSGGQVGDSGTIRCDDVNEIEIYHTHKTADGRFVHVGKVISGEIRSGRIALARVDEKKRGAISRAHTTTHLLQKALSQVLGSHVEQAGSYVNADTVRFDFVHFSSMTNDELKRVEDIVNQAILDDLTVEILEVPIEEAKKLGATALFNDKYGDIVRVVKVGDFSIEFCGGTHVKNTAKAGCFKIISENSVAAGVRRIEAITGLNVCDFTRKIEHDILEIAHALKTTSAEIMVKVHHMLNDNRELLRNIDKMSAKIANHEIIDLFNFSKQVKGINVISAKFDDTSMDTLRVMGDSIKQKAPKMVAVLSTVLDGKINFLCVCGQEAIAMGAHAGRIIKEVSKLTGGGGGGRADSATAGGKEVSKLEIALEEVNNIIERLI